MGQGPVVDNAVLLLARSDTITLGNTIGGSGFVYQGGSGKVILTASNGYTGGTAVNAGTLAVSSTANLGSGGLSFGGSGTGMLDITGSNAFTFSQTVTLGQNATIEQNDSAAATLSAGISGPGTLIKSGSGWLTLSGTNSYAGGTTVSAGTLQILDRAALPGSALVVSAGAR